MGKGMREWDAGSDSQSDADPVRWFKCEELGKDEIVLERVRCLTGGAAGFHLKNVRILCDVTVTSVSIIQWLQGTDQRTGNGP